MNLESLKKAMAPLTKFGQEELTFDVEGTSVTVRPLLPREEVAAQQYAVVVLAETQEEEGLEDTDALSRTAALRYFDQFRTEIIAYALVEIGGTSLRVNEIETGEELENGVRVKIPKHVALRKIISESWSRGMITIVWSKYGDLMARIATKADKVTEESLGEIDAEIERVKKRLESLEEEKERRAKGDPGVTATQITALVDAGKAMEQEVHEAVAQVDADQKAANEFRRIAREREASEPSEGEPVAAPPRRAVVPRTSPPPSGPPPEFVSSFSDPEDGGDLYSEEIRAEMQRQARLAEARSDEEAGNPTARAVPAGRVGDKEAFRLPPTTLSARGQAPSAGPAKLDPPPGAGAKNPNFRG